MRVNHVLTEVQWDQTRALPTAAPPQSSVTSECAGEWKRLFFSPATMFFNIASLFTFLVRSASWPLVRKNKGHVQVRAHDWLLPTEAWPFLRVARRQHSARHQWTPTRQRNEASLALLSRFLPMPRTWDVLLPRAYKCQLCFVCRSKHKLYNQASLYGSCCFKSCRRETMCFLSSVIDRKKKGISDQGICGRGKAADVGLTPVSTPKRQIRDALLLS